MEGGCNFLEFKPKYFSLPKYTCFLVCQRKFHMVKFELEDLSIYYKLEYLVSILKMNNKKKN